MKPYTEEVVGDVRTPVMLLFGATLLVLLIACANVGNLLLLRGEGRRSQFALRAALGAGRAHLARQVGAEALVLCGLGGACGVLLAYWGLDVVVALSPPELPRVDFLRIDGRVVLFSLASTLAAAAAASLLSTLVSTRLTGAILSSGSSRLASTAFPQSRRALVVTQVALSMTIVAGAGVLTRTLLKLQSAEMGFAASRLAFVELFLPPGQYQDVKVRRPLLEELAARVRSIPGVDDVVPIAVSPYAGLSGWDMPTWSRRGKDRRRLRAIPGSICNPSILDISKRWEFPLSRAVPSIASTARAVCGWP